MPNSSVMTDEQIVFLYRKYYQRLFVFATGILGNDEESRDVVNDVFEAIWRGSKCQGYDERAICAYAYKLVRNRSLDLLRHRVVEERYQQLCHLTSFVADETETMEFEQRIERLRKLLDALPEPGQTVIKTYYYKHLTHQQVADELNISVHVVHKTLTKMYARLREMLNKEK